MNGVKPKHSDKELKPVKLTKNQNIAMDIALKKAKERKKLEFSNRG